MVALYYTVTILTFLAMCGSAWVAVKRDAPGLAILTSALFILFCVEVVGVWNLAAADTCRHYANCGLR